MKTLKELTLAVATREADLRNDFKDNFDREYFINNYEIQLDQWEERTDDEFDIMISYFKGNNHFEEAFPVKEIYDGKGEGEEDRGNVIGYEF